MNGCAAFGYASQRPNATGVSPVTSGSLDQRLNNYINPAAFSTAPQLTFGNVGRTIDMRGPGQANWDLSVFKNVVLGERFKAQFRCEAYNALNHSQFAAMDTGARFDATGKQVNAKLGAFTIARPPRVMQFLLRATF